MKATEVSPNIVQLTRFGLVNAYLVKEDDGFTLVDTMIRGSGKKLIAAVADRGGEIKRIAPTHAHDDHIGALAELAKALPDAEIVVGKRDGRFIHGDKSLDPGEPKGKLVPAKSAPGVKFDREVVEGDQIGSLRIYTAPGHSPGQIAMFDERDGVLISADSFSTVGGVATTAGPYWRFPLPGFVTWNRGLALETAIKLRGLDPEWLAPGHGKPVRKPGLAMDTAIAKRA
jgi:glyoxylase-like metal-dependent hydrolase (beta-lactamase superfamily II)